MSVFFSVAARAVGDLCVGSFEFVSGFRVVEILCVQLEKFDLLALVFGMAYGALLCFILMIASLFRYALGYLLVAGEAVLGRNLELLVVAFHAVFDTRVDGVSQTQLTRCVFDGIFLLGESKRKKDEGNKKRAQKYFLKYTHSFNSGVFLRCPNVIDIMFVVQHTKKWILFQYEL